MFFILQFYKPITFLLCVIRKNLMHYLSSVYFVSQPLHVSGIFVAHPREVYCICTAVGTCCAVQLTVCWPCDYVLKCKEMNWRKLGSTL
jgi:hypothetical protein